jgi:hypothetical protein
VIECCCSVATHTLALSAKKCGAQAYPGVTIVVKQAGTTVDTCTTDASGNCPTYTLTAGLVYDITATDPHGLALTHSVTLSINTTYLFTFVTPIEANFTDECGNPLSGAIGYFSATGWSDTATSDAFGNAIVYPNVDLTGLTVSVYFTYSGATTPTQTFVPSYPSACGTILSFYVVENLMFNVATSCGAVALPGATVAVTGPVGETGTATTDSSGNVVVSISPPIGDPSAGMSWTASHTGYTSFTGTFGTCPPYLPAGGGYCYSVLNIACQSTTIAPDGTTFVCINSCTVAQSTASLTANDGVGNVTLTWDATNQIWAGCAMRTSSFTVSPTGCPTASPPATGAASVPVLFVFDPSAPALVLYGLTCGSSPEFMSGKTCFTTVPTSGFTSMAINTTGGGTLTCPPSFSFSRTHTMVSGDGLWQNIYGAAGTHVTFSVTP